MNSTASQRLAAYGSNIGQHIPKTPAQMEYHREETMLGHRRSRRTTSHYIHCAECKLMGGTFVRRLNIEGWYDYVHMGSCEAVRAKCFFETLATAGPDVWEGLKRILSQKKGRH